MNYEKSIQTDGFCVCTIADDYGVQYYPPNADSNPANY